MENYGHWFNVKTLLSRRKYQMEVLRIGSTEVSTIMSNVLCIQHSSQATSLLSLSNLRDTSLQVDLESVQMLLFGTIRSHMSFMGFYNFFPCFVRHLKTPS